MKTWTKFLFGLFAVALVSGCTTIYGVAVDERSVETIAADQKIKAAILSKFVEDEQVKILDLGAYCYNGHVYVVGEYDQAKQRDRALEVAKSVKGVKSVSAYALPKKKNDSCGMKDNVSIHAKVKARLIGDKGIESTNVDIKVIQCRVVLLGIVETRGEIDKSVAHARSVEGVREVKSFLRAAR